VKFQLRFFKTKQEKIPFIEWLEGLDKKTQARIRNRLVRMENGNFGDSKGIKQGLYELRLFFGSGYRIYYGVLNNKVVLLISGGDKNTQTKDIDNALTQWKTYKKEH
tara:strand:+ start:903 stop:1223 length:321 start_codon:yes stop_codon:yes gene_type:complete